MMIKRLILTFLCLAGLAAPILSQAQERGSLLPVRPAELLKCLPPAEEGWVLKASGGEHVLNIRPMSQAERTYIREANPGAPAPAPTGAVPPAETLRINIVDIADNGVFAENFELNREKAKKITVGAISAYRVPQEGEADHLEALLFKRFVVTVVLAAPAGGAADKWLSKIDLQALESAANKKEFFSRKTDVNFVSERVDELNPKRTRSTVWSIAPEPLPDPPPAVGTP
jgi:hypothetical protein